MNIRKILSLLLVMSLLLSVSALAAYPEKNINGIVQWGAGGGTDSLMRPLCALAEKELGKSIVVQNMTGGTGSIAAQYVHDRPSDGYTLLLGAENPALYQVLEISSLTYADFDCVLLIGDETCGIIVGSNSEYTTLTELIEAALEQPGKLTLATTGTGGLPWEVAAMLTSVTGATFNQIPYDSDASALRAVMSGECAFTVCKVQTGLEAHNGGLIRFISMLSKESVEVLKDVPLIGAEYPDFDAFLPWGPFYGVFVKDGTNEAQTVILSDAFLKAFDSDEYRQLLDSFYINPLGLSGEDAESYIAAWQENTVSSLQKSGAVE